MIDPYEQLWKRIADEAKSRVEDLKALNPAKTESPIENLMYVALVMACSYDMTEAKDMFFAKDDEAAEYWKQRYDTRSALIVQTQAQVAGWRVDFLVHYYDWNRATEGEWKKLIVECDGHAFHERTKEQAARDRSRDRAAQIEGIPVLRFTGSEIWNDPWECVEQIIDWVRRGL